ncbi:uncharacterized protein LOC143607669 [Bidens hawaiensis]|uniref:uncharacterized protein LOC143607669 n=1 Tax=Bidens hawaiensis TaxID=980011 RepID=UPI00404B15B8
MSSLSSSAIVFVFLIVLVIVIPNAAPCNVHKPYQLVNNVCRKLENKRFCLAALKSDTRSKFAKNITTLTTIAVNVAAKNSTATRDSFLGVKTGSPGLLKSLKYCINSYNNVITTFRICLSEGECTLIGYDIYLAGDSVRLCQSITDRNGAHDSFITTSNKVTLEFCGLAELLADLMCDKKRFKT